ncbi:beta-lactamase family protein [Parvularcula flava]|nr:serine hydrolase domain-containing protein [Aquisalinus luteolus]NHK28637.1 beta-lactamase family protein [Aquisalinus luteolus]
MKSYFCSTIAASLCAILPGTVSAQEDAPGQIETKLEDFRNFLQEYRRDNRVLSFSVALVKDGEIVLAEGIGWQDHDAEEPTTADTSYLVASITKTFTAATLLQMDADGHIDLDDDFTELSDWDGRCEWLAGSGIIFGGGTLEDGTVIEAPRCDTPITLRQVLSHRVNGEPGTRFFYNPVVFGRLANYVEEQTGRSWVDWVDQYVIDKGNLNDIAAGWRDEDKGHVLTHLAPPFMHVPLEEDSDGLQPSPLPNPEMNASSGIIASARVLAEYSIALDENRIMTEELKERMWTPPTDLDGTPAPHAYGWFVQDWEGHRLVWHTGWWPDAYAGLLLKAPDDGWTLVALGNTDGIRTDINTLADARVQDHPLAAEFLKTFVAD